MLPVTLADALLRDILGHMGKLSREKRPPLKSVTVHPDDFQAICDHAAVKATTPEGLRFGNTSGPLLIRDVPIYQSRHVPIGTLWFDPPRNPF